MNGCVLLWWPKEMSTPPTLCLLYSEWSSWHVWPFPLRGSPIKCPPPPASIIHTQPFLLLQYIQAISEWESLLLNQIYWSDSPIHLVFYGNLRLFQLCLNLYFDTIIVEVLCLWRAAVQPMDLWLGLLISSTCKTIGFTLQVEWAGPHKVQIVLMLHSNKLFVTTRLKDSDILGLLLANSVNT